ncbi:MAG: hypothetical protein R2728_11420 [Chitinophagales bacterium]
MLELLTIIYKWKWHIGIICVLAVLASVIFSGPKFMPPYYESFSIFYPSNPAATDRSTLFGEDAGNRQVSYFGTKSDVNRMLTIANSGGLMNHIIEKHDLVNHYNVNTDNPKHLFYVGREFQGNYEAIKTDKEAIQIRILDQDPEKASLMVNDVVSYINEVNNAILRDNKSRTITIFDKELKEKEAEIIELNTELKGLNNATQNSGRIQFVNSRIESLTEEINDLQKLYDQYKISADEGFASIYLIETAAPALTKSKPVRWMIVAFTGLGAFAFSVLLAIILEKFKEVKANI